MEGCNVMFRVALVSIMTDPLGTVMDFGGALIVLAVLVGVAWRVFKDIAKGG